MSTGQKFKLAKHKLAAAAQQLLASDPGTIGLPPNVRITTNATAVARFPITLTLPSAMLVAVGILAAWRGHRALGVIIGGLGATGIGAAAAAPELSAQLSKMRSAI